MSKCYQLLLLLCFVALTLSCGEVAVAPENGQYNEGMELLNKRDYKGAARVFEELASKYPEKSKYKQLLADSYLGLGGFELFDFILSIETLLSRSFTSEDLYKELKSFTSAYALTSKTQKQYLVRALEMYSKLNLGDFSKTKEGRLKKGLVHFYLLTQSIKSLVAKVQSPTFEQPKDIDHLKKIYDQFAQKYVVNVDELIFHSFESYFSLQDTYREVQKLFVEIDRSVEEVFGRPLNRIRGETRDMNLQKFIHLFIKYNPGFYKQVVTMLFQTCDRDEAALKLKLLQESISKVETSSPYKGSAIKTIEVMRKQIATRSENICSRDDILNYI